MENVAVKSDIDREGRGKYSIFTTSILVDSKLSVLLKVRLPCEGFTNVALS